MMGWAAELKGWRRELVDCPLIFCLYSFIVLVLAFEGWVSGVFLVCSALCIVTRDYLIRRWAVRDTIDTFNEVYQEAVENAGKQRRESGKVVG